MRPRTSPPATPIEPTTNTEGRNTIAAGTIPSTSSAAEPAAPIATTVAMFLIKRSPSMAAPSPTPDAAVVPMALCPVTHDADCP
jgi:hypothetical protein